MIEAPCPCGRKTSVQDALAGRRIRCPGCGAALAVPAAEVELALEPPASAPAPARPLDVAPWEQPSARRQPLVTQDVSRKAFPALVWDSLVSPLGAFEAMGIYILQSRLNLGLTVALFACGMMVDAAVTARTPYGGEQPTFASALMLVLVVLPVRVLLFDVCARVIAGVGRFVPMLVVMVFLMGLVNCAQLVTWLALMLAPDFAPYVGFVLWMWSLILQYCAIAGTYDVEMTYVTAFLAGAYLLESWVIAPMVLLASMGA